ncbi:MAG: hypothetical protein K8H74_17040 [Notoacmeibacter sp.]|nr:hypothetical protein [Notoacmeibacter sp.]
MPDPRETEFGPAEPVNLDDLNGKLLITQESQLVAVWNGTAHIFTLTSDEMRRLGSALQSAAAARDKGRLFLSEYSIPMEAQHDAKH